MGLGKNSGRLSIITNREDAIRVGLVLSLTLLTGVAGVLPHLFFRYDLGGDFFFQGAWDEAFYALVMSGEIANWNNYPARLLAEMLLTTTGGPSPLFATLSDIIWPALVMLSAGTLALMFTRGTIAVIPVAFLIVFSSDVLGFNSSVIHGYSNTISSLLRDFPAEIRQFFSDPYTTFLYIYRTPEPQLSLPIFFAYLAVIARFISLPAPRSHDWLILIVISFVSVTSYVFFAIGSLMLGAAGCVSLALVRRWSQAGGLLVIAALCGAWLGSQLLSSHAGEANAMTFYSSLPMLAPSMLYGGFLVFAFSWAFRRGLTQDPALIFAIFCFLFPFAALNQQVITGVMVQTLNWERYVNFPILVLGFLIFAERIDWLRLREGTVSRVRQLLIPSRDRWFSIKWVPNKKIEQVLFKNVKAMLPVIFFLLGGIFLYNAQLSTYRSFAHFNVLTTGYAMLIDRVHAARPDAPRRIILANMAYDAAVRARVKTPGLVFNGYTSLVMSLNRLNIDMEEDAHNKQGSYQNWGFDYAASLGLTPEEYENKLRAEIDGGSCWPHLMFHAKFLDCAPYVSDFRTYFPENLKQRISPISERYRQYILKTKENRIGEALVLLPNQDEAPDPNGLWRREPFGSLKLSIASNGFAPSVSMELYIFWQKPNNFHSPDR